MAARGGRGRSGGGGRPADPGTLPEEEEAEEEHPGVDRKSVLISSLVKQVKERKMSKGELFQELSSLQQQRRPSRSPPDASSASSSAASSTAQRSHRHHGSRGESSNSVSSADGRLGAREPGRFDSSGDASLQDAGQGGLRRMPSDQASVGSRSSPQPPPGQGPVSGFWDPDRRALIQRLLEEKRKGSGGGGVPAPAAGSSSNSSVNEGEAFAGDQAAAARRGLEIDTRARPQQHGGGASSYHHQHSRGSSHRRPGSASTGRPSSAPRVGGHGRYPTYPPARGSLDDSEVVRGAYRSAEPQGRGRAGDSGGNGPLSFRPKIKDLPRHYGRSMKEERDLSFHDRVMRWQREREFEAAKRREESEMKEVDGCTFHPSINPASRRSVESARLPGDHRTVNERLYDHVKKMKEQREKSVAHAREQEEKRLRKECTFKPNLRSSASSLRYFSSRPGSPQVERVTSRYLSSPQRLRYFAGVPAGMEECTFRPRTNPVQAHMGSARLYLEASVVERLTRHTSAPLNNSHAAGYSDYQAEGDALSPRDHLHLRSPRSAAQHDDSDGPMLEGLDRPEVMDLPSYMSSIQYATQPRSARDTPPHRSSGSGPARPSSAPTRRSRPGMDQQGGEHDEAYSMFNRAEREERRRAFHEFLARQTQRELHKQKKMKELAEKYQPKFNPKLSKLSLHIFQQQNKGSFLERMERDALKKERLADKLRLMREAADRACTFKPEITKKSAEMQSRTPVEMSRGDLLRKETNARLLRLRFEKERYSDFTFQPRLNQENQPNVGSRLRILSEPDTYLERLARELKRKADLSRRVQQEREMAELSECTFKPQTQDCPAFIKRIARSLALTKGVSGRSNETPERNKPEWR